MNSVHVGLARADCHYRGLEAPFDPGLAYPEFLATARVTQAAFRNSVYAGVRGALRALGLDADRFGSDSWNPLEGFVTPGGSVVLKPNFIRHWNPNEGEGGSVQSVITHGAVVRALVDYAFLAVGPGGQVSIAEAPQQDCDFREIVRIAGLDALVEHCARHWDSELAVIDLRREAVAFADGVIVERKPLPGDPLGYRAVDLARRSAFEGSGLDPSRLRGADYDPGPTAEHHRNGRNAYLLSETVLQADLVVNLPKLKTHKKTGVTLALKNLVGINGDKNWLPHHTAGPVNRGGDEFPGHAWLDRARSVGTDWARGLLARGMGTGLFRRVRRVEDRLRRSDFIRSGNWWGNDTTWRMVLDLNRCLYYSDAQGLHSGRQPVRRVLTVMDGVVAGEGDGPLAPHDRPLGVILAATDPVALDLVAVQLMGFDANRIPKIREAMASSDMRVTAVREVGDVAVTVASEDGTLSVPQSVGSFPSEGVFRAHPGWRGHVERT